MFQQTVNRQYTTGFPGDIVRDGPYRAKPGRMQSGTAALTFNAISRAFGTIGDIPPAGSNPPDFTPLDQLVAVGAPVFYGVLGNTKHYALAGTAQGGPLAPTTVLPDGTEGEFFDMVTGMVMELFNEQSVAKTMGYGNSVAYVPNNISAANNPNNLPYGALVSFPSSIVTPTLNSATGSATGGTLAAATYYYKVSALGASGETIGSNELSVTTTGTTSSVALSWGAVPGATGYKVYRGTAAGAENVYYAPAGTGTTFTDTGAASTAGSPLATSTATVSAPAGMVVIPNARVLQNVTGMAASSPTAQTSTYAVVQLTQ